MIIFNSIFENKINIVIGKEIINSFPKHIHDSYCINTVTKGKLAFKFKDNTQIVKTNELLIINPNISHSVKILDYEYASYNVICIKKKSFNDFLNLDKNQKLIFISKTIKDKKTVYHLKKIFDSLLNNNTDNIKYNIMKFIDTIYNRYSLKNKNTEIKTKKTLKALTYIDNNYKTIFSLNQIADNDNLSPYHFTRIFTSEIGIPPYNYLINKKIKESLKLLINEQSIIDTALELGFYDQSHFTRFFKKHIGVSPGDYIKYNS